MANHIAIQEMLDREAIRALPLAYCHYVWQQDLNGYLSLFTDDCSFINSDPTLPGGEGKAGLSKMISDAFAWRPRPFIHNHVIELLGPDRAKGVCYAEVRMVREGKKYLLAAWYDDEYVKVGDKWKFKSRRTNVDSLDPVD